MRGDTKLMKIASQGVIFLKKLISVILELYKLRAILPKNHLPLTLTDASKAKIYESGPNPVIWPLQTDAINDLCRNSSRA